MRLAYAQFAPLVQGAERIVEADGWFRLDRFTERQVEAYRRAGNPDFVAKTAASASIRLALRTDSRHLRFTYRHRIASSRPFAWFDLCLDGVLAGHFGTDEATDGLEGKAELALGEGEKLVEVTLPWSRRTDLSAIELDDGSSFAPAPRPLKLRAYGDSITHGYDALYPSLAYIEQFASMIGADVTNKAIGGDCFFPELIDGEGPDAPDLVVVAYGTNDWSHQTAGSTYGRARSFLAKLSARHPSVPVLAVSPIWRADWEDFAGRPFGAPATAVAPLLRKAAEGLANVTVLDGWSFVPHLREFYSDRRLHPNDLGFGLYARRLLRSAGHGLPLLRSATALRP